MLDIRFADGVNNVGSGDMDLFAHIRHGFRHEANEYLRAGWIIRDGIRLSHSIDDFLDLHSQDARLNLVGKTAIVKSVLEAERNSKLFYQRQGEDVDLALLQNTWFVKFMQMLGRGTSRENVRTIFDSVTFIVFNYDRCLEQFLLHALQRLYSIPDVDASQILSAVRIIHPYGVVGELQTRTAYEGTSFGSGADLRADYVGLSKKIRTYTEQMTDQKLLTRIHEEVTKAECIVFLGFAYHTQNMRLLWPPKGMPHKFVFGTAYGMSDADTEVVSHQIAGRFTPNMTSKMREDIIKIESKLTCAGLFDHFALSLPGT